MSQRSDSFASPATSATPAAPATARRPGLRRWWIPTFCAAALLIGCGEAADPAADDVGQPPRTEAAADATDAATVEYEAAYPEEVSDEGLSDEDRRQQEAHSHGGDEHSHGDEGAHAHDDAHDEGDHSHGEDEHHGDEDHGDDDHQH